MCEEATGCLEQLREPVPDDRMEPGGVACSSLTSKIGKTRGTQKIPEKGLASVMMNNELYKGCHPVLPKNSYT
jgi:hypothetical protein